MTLRSESDGAGECNCPSSDDVFASHVQIGTKPPCPVHDTPERLKAMEGMFLPLIKRRDDA